MQKFIRRTRLPVAFRTENYLDPETGQQTFFVTFGALVLFLLPMLFVRLLAIRVERRAEEKGAAACQAKV